MEKVKETPKYSKLSRNKNVVPTEDIIGFFNDKYDFLVNVPTSKSVFMKVKIKSISKFSPKIVL